MNSEQEMIGMTDYVKIRKIQTLKEVAVFILKF